MADKRHKIWAPATPRPVAPDAAEKPAIIAVCEALIDTVLRPRYLEVRPTGFTSPVDI
jgi:hypothetical protein